MRKTLKRMIAPRKDVALVVPCERPSGYRPSLEAMLQRFPTASSDTIGGPELAPQIVRPDDWRDETAENASSVHSNRAVTLLLKIFGIV